MRIVFAALFTIMAADAQAHEAGAEAGDPWNYLFVVLPLALTALAYGIGMRRLWSASARGQTIHLQRAVCFAAGWLFLAAALVSPLDRLATQLFTAHMIEHEILMVIAAPLFVLSKPLAPLLWSLPQKLRASVGRALVRSVVLLPVRKAATNQLFATGLHGATLWLWHAPRLYDAALAETPVHWLQHLSFFCTALIFWWALLFGRGRRITAPPSSIFSRPRFTPASLASCSPSRVSRSTAVRAPALQAGACRRSRTSSLPV